MMAMELRTMRRRWVLSGFALLIMLSGAVPVAAQSGVKAVVPLFVNRATIGTSAECDVSASPHSGLQVSVAPGTCTDLAIATDGTIDGASWGAIPIDGGGSTITETDVPAGSTGLWSLPTGLRKVRVRATTVSSCTFSVYCAPNP